MSILHARQQGTGRPAQRSPVEPPVPLPRGHHPSGPRPAKTPRTPASFHEGSTGSTFQRFPRSEVPQTQIQGFHRCSTAVPRVEARRQTGFHKVPLFSVSAGQRFHRGSTGPLFSGSRCADDTESSPAPYAASPKGVRPPRKLDEGSRKLDTLSRKLDTLSRILDETPSLTRGNATP